jgi:diguanylate cyclase (GGDEF)-like protein
MRRSPTTFDAAPRWGMRVLAALILCGVLASMAIFQLQVDAKTHQDLQDRFHVRATTASTFLQSYVTYTLGREGELASQLLADEHVTDEQFQSFLRIFGFGPAVLLDASGNALDVSPAKPELLGTNLAERYPHLASAVGGTPAVSAVVPAAVNGAPIVAFATPFDTLYGRRVVSGAYSVKSRPMGIYLAHLLPYEGSEVYLTDQSGITIATHDGSDGPLASLNSTLAGREREGATSGTYDAAHGESYFQSVPIDGTPWTLSVSVPTSELFKPVDSNGRLLPWLFLGAFAITASILVGLWIHAREQRSALRVQASVDTLTGVANRRGGEQFLAYTLLAGQRDETMTGLLVIDADHFKTVNDKWGHGHGDAVLMEVAERLQRCVRGKDMVVRWGGEEFVVILPETNTRELAAAAERLRAAIAGEPVHVDGDDVPVTISIGGIAGTSTDADTMLEIADRCLYEAKDAGRNRVVVDGAPRPDSVDLRSSLTRSDAR